MGKSERRPQRTERLDIRIDPADLAALREWFTGRYQTVHPEMNFSAWARNALRRQKELEDAELDREKKK